MEKKSVERVNREIAEKLAKMGDDKVICPHCGKENDAKLIYCTSCLTPLYGEERSAVCGHMTPVNARFCRECGAKQ